MKTFPVEIGLTERMTNFLSIVDASTIEHKKIMKADKKIIKVAIINNHRLTIRTKDGNEEFVFEESSPETVRLIGEALIIASELAK